MTAAVLAPASGAGMPAETAVVRAAERAVLADVTVLTEAERGVLKECLDRIAAQARPRDC